MKKCNSKQNQTDMPGKITYIHGNEALLDEIKQLWQGLNQHHAAVSQYFSEDFKAFTFDQRSEKLRGKYQPGKLRIDIAKAGDSAIGYVISSITADGVGEIESIFIEQAHRGQAIGSELMRRVLRWFDISGVEKRVVKVAEGNEAVYPFYAGFGFFPRLTLLQQKNTEKDN
jgi:GNAT superfamily N-acetyltransferase